MVLKWTRHQKVCQKRHDVHNTSLPTIHHGFVILMNGEVGRSAWKVLHATRNLMPPLAYSGNI